MSQVTLINENWNGVPKSSDPDEYTDVSTKRLPANYKIHTLTKVNNYDLSSNKKLKPWSDMGLIIFLKTNI